MTTAGQGTTLNKRQMVEAIFASGKKSVGDVITGVKEAYEVEVSANYVDTLLRKMGKGGGKKGPKAAKGAKTAKAPKGAKAAKAKGSVPGSKAEMVRALLSAGITATSDVVEQVKSKWNIKVSAGYVDTLRAQMAKGESTGKPATALATDPESKKALIIAVFKGGVKEPAEIVKALAEKHKTTATVTYVYKILGQYRKDSGLTGKARGRRSADAEFEDVNKRGRKPREAGSSMTIDRARQVLQSADQSARAVSEALVSQFGIETVRGLLDAISARNLAVIGHVA